jgi:predicted nucleic acid-binding protein
MRIVVDANIVISALIRDSRTRKILLSTKFDLVPPDFVLGEISKYSDYISKKAGISRKDLDLLMALVFQSITVIPAEDYESCKDKALSIMKDDVKDVPYVACCLALGCDGIWTNDSDYEGKMDIRTLSTGDMLRLMTE